MRADKTEYQQLAPKVRGVIQGGAWLSMGFIVLGLVGQPWLGSEYALRLLIVGLGILIATPIARLLMLLVGYYRLRNLRYAGLTMLVLTLIGLGIAYGMLKIG